MSELLDVRQLEGGFGAVRELRGGPVPKEVVLENIRKSAEFKVPVYRKQPTRKGSMIFVAGGTTLTNYVDELKRRKAAGDFICTSNNTHDYLVEWGIVPDVCALIDPKEVVKNYVKKPTKGVKYIVGTCCNPGVAQNLINAGADVSLLLTAYGFEDSSDIDLQRSLFDAKKGSDFLVGGTMMGLRAMPLAIILGFKKIEYYGFDSSFADDLKIITEDDPDFKKVVAENEGRIYEDSDTKKKYTITEQGGFFYAYPKKRAEHIQAAETKDGRRFWTSPAMAYQANQFIYWVDRMERKLEVVVHGDSLSNHMLKLHREQLENAVKTVGDKRWTKEYGELQKKLHETGRYGKWGGHDIEFAGRMILSLYYKLRRKIRILDYGCGDCSLGNEIEKIFNNVEVTNYDPHQEKYSKEPEGLYDLVMCNDVMEHVEYQCVPNVLKHIGSFIKYAAIFSVATEDAEKELDDGRNAHVTLRSVPWWSEKIGMVCIPKEILNAKNGFVMVCQGFNASECMTKEGHKDYVKNMDELAA